MIDREVENSPFIISKIPPINNLRNPMMAKDEIPIRSILPKREPVPSFNETMPYTAKKPISPTKHRRFHYECVDPSM